MIDFHSHVLPKVDDGSRHMEESLGILKRQYAKGIHQVIATPHFYPEDDWRVFLRKRKLAKEEVERALEETGKGSMKLIGGAEVLLSVDTWAVDGLEELCIEGTSYILLEMPYSHWSDWVYTSVETIIDSRKLRPIIAHVERYDAVMENPNRLQRFLEMGALLQINTYSLSKGSSREKLAHKLIKHGMIHLLGSDVHRDGPFVTVREGYDIIGQHHGVKVAEKMQQIGQEVLQNQKVTVKDYTQMKKILGRWY